MSPPDHSCSKWSQDWHPPIAERSKLRPERGTAEAQGHPSRWQQSGTREQDFHVGNFLNKHRKIMKMNFFIPCSLEHVGHVWVCSHRQPRGAVPYGGCLLSSRGYTNHGRTTDNSKRTARAHLSPSLLRREKQVSTTAGKGKRNPATQRIRQAAMDLT